MTEEEIFVRKEVEKIYPQLLKNAKKVCGSGYDMWGHDLLPVALTFFLEKPLEQQLRTIQEGKLENFITWIMNIQLKSNSSFYFNLYRKPNSKYRELYSNYEYDISDESFNKEDALACVEKELNLLEPNLRDAVIGIIYGETTMTNSARDFNMSSGRFKRLLDETVIKISEKCQDCI